MLRASHVVLVLATLLVPTLARAGKLADLRDRTGSSSNNSDSSSSSSSNDDDDDDDDDCSFLQALFGCRDDEEDEEQTEMHTASGSTFEAAPTQSALLHSYFFLPYPYAFGNAGNGVALRLPRDSINSDCWEEDTGCLEEQNVSACIDGNCFSVPASGAVELSPTRRALQSARIQLFADVGKDTDGLTRGTLGGVLDSSGGLGLDSRWTYWVEQLPEAHTDTLWLGDVNVRLAVLSAPAVQLAVGLGARVLAPIDSTQQSEGEESNVSAGVNGSLSLEVYPIRPLVLRSEFDVGNLGPAVFWEGQASAGVVIKRLELYAGAARFALQHIEFDSAFAGLRVHL